MAASCVASGKFCKCGRVGSDLSALFFDKAISGTETDGKAEWLASFLYVCLYLFGHEAVRALGCVFRTAGRGVDSGSL